MRAFSLLKSPHIAWGSMKIFLLLSGDGGRNSRLGAAATIAICRRTWRRPALA